MVNVHVCFHVIQPVDEDENYMFCRCFFLNVIVGRSQVSANSLGKIQEDVASQEVLLLESEPTRTTPDWGQALTLANPHKAHGPLVTQLHKGEKKRNYAAVCFQTLNSLNEWIVWVPEVRGQEAHGHCAWDAADFGISVHWRCMCQCKGGQGLIWGPFRNIILQWFATDSHILFLKDPVDLSHASHKKLCDCAGNGMHVPSVGFAVLTAVLALQPV